MAVFPSSMPYDEVSIFDQSQYIEEQPADVISTVPTGPIMFCPFVSERGYGEDNKLMYMNGARLAKYGTPNLKKYGLSLYLANRFLAAGGSILGMRVMPSGAVAASSTIYATIADQTNEYDATLDDDSNATIDGNKMVRFTYSGDIPVKPTGEGTYTPAKTNVKAKINKNTGNEVYIGKEGDNIVLYVKDTDTYNKIGTAVACPGKCDVKFSSSQGTYELFKVSAKAAGTFGNNFTYRIVKDEITTDRLNDKYCVYNFIDTDGGNKLDDTITFSFDDDCKYDSEYIDIDTVFDEYTENIKLEKCKGFAEFKKAVMDALQIDDSVFNKLDILFGTNTDSYHYHVVYDNDDSKVLTGTIGIKLTGGTDGWGNNVEFKFETDADAEGYTGDPFASELAKAYNGKKTDLIYDEVRYPFEFMYAPSTDSDLMTAMFELTKADSENARRITHVEFFTPKFETHAKAQEWMKKHNDIKEFRQYFCHSWAQIRDPYTNKKVYMPAVYFDSYGECSVWLRNPGAPYAGERNYRWDNFITGSLVPASSRRDNLIANHNVGLNTMIEDGNGYASPYEQITAQQRSGITSELSEKNNVFTLCEMVRIALKIANENRWGSLSDTDISNYKTLVENSISVQLRSCYEQMEVLAERQAVNGAGRKRIRCKINVVFNAMLKGVSYEFYILANA